MALLLTLTAVVAVFSAIIYYFLTSYYNFWKNKGVVGPEPSLFFGNIKDHVLRKEGVYDYAVKFYNEYPNEPFVGAFRMRTPVLIIRDLELVKSVMIKDFDCFVQRGIELHANGLGLNLFHADPENWRILRNKFTPTFTSGKLKNMFHLLDVCADKFIDFMEKSTLKQSEIDMYPYVQKYTKSGISSCAFGIDLDLDNEKMFETLKWIDTQVLDAKFFNEIDYLLPGILKNLKIDFFPTKVTNYFVDLVKDLFSQRNGMPSNRKDFMDLIIEMKNNGDIHSTKRNESDVDRKVEISDELIAANVFVFYVAGYETSASTMSFMFHELAYNPDIQDRLIQEIDDVLEQHGKITYDALQQMTYLTQVLDETLRKYPIVDPLTRVSTVNYKIPGTDVVLDKGTTVLVPVRAIHYDPKYYPEPEKFNPERFSPENVKIRHPAAYLPFGIGPRNCIGMRFAQISSRVCIAKLLMKFRVEPGSNSCYNLKYNPKLLILNSINGVPVKLIPRN